MAVAVAAQAVEHGPAGSDRHPAPLLELGQVSVVDARDGFGDYPCRAGSHTVEVGEGACRRPLGEFGVTEGLSNVQGPLEGSHLGAGSELPVEVVNRQRQRYRGSHGSEPTGGRRLALWL